MAQRFSRSSPSPRYRRLVEQYKAMHEHGEIHLGIPPENTFPGASLPKEAARIKRMIRATGAKSILDYGAGKGQQYWPMRTRDDEEGVEYPDIRSFWGVTDIRCYDPGFSTFAELPTGHFDGVICTDVLEHCPEEDIPWILGELFGFAQKFVYANVACFPARKRLPSGGNAHCTVKPVRWWEEQISRAAKANPAALLEFRLVYRKGTELKEHVIASASMTSRTAG